MSTGDSTTIKNHAAFIWSVADLLRGDYKQSEYGKVILPLTVLRRLDCVLEPTKAKVLAVHAKYGARSETLDPILQAASGEQFFNTSKLTLARALDDPGHLAANLRAYIARFSPGARDVLDKFDLPTQIARLDRANLLYKVVARFCDLDLHPDAVSNLEMGYLYEELVRRFSELSNETAGEHFTPREVIQLMVRLLFIEDDALLTKPGIVKTLFDPACGTGGMLSVAEDHLRHLNPAARLEVFGQELNAETYAICRSDMMLKGQSADRIALGNSFTEDGHAGRRFDYLLANPPFGVEWRKVEDEIRSEHATLGFNGRFGAGLPRINDGSFLFLQHMISKMKVPGAGGSRLAIVFNGSPLFTGAAGSGESEIRRWIIENDWLEAVVALPDQIFYNTGISTYFWVVTNRKPPERKGTVQLVDARASWTKMRKSLGEKRKQIAEDQIADIVRLYGDRVEGDRVKILPNEAFGFLRVTVERPLRLRWEATPDTLAVVAAGKHVGKLAPEVVQSVTTRLETLPAPVSPDAMRAVLNGLALRGKPLQTEVLAALAIRDPEAEVIKDKKGNAEPDPELRDQENVPLPSVSVTFKPDVTPRLATLEYRTAVEDHLTGEVLPYVPDAWLDHDKTKIGYEIPLTRHFYRYIPPRPLAEIDSEIMQLESEIQDLLGEITGSAACRTHGTGTSRPLGSRALLGLPDALCCLCNDLRGLGQTVEQAGSGLAIANVASPAQGDRMTRAGFPTATTLLGRVRVTTAPAPTTVFSPMLTPGRTMTPPPSQTFELMMIGLAASHLARRASASTGWVGVRSWTLGPICTSSPILMVATSRATRPRLMKVRAPTRIW